MDEPRAYPFLCRVNDDAPVAPDGIEVTSPPLSPARSPRDGTAKWLGDRSADADDLRAQGWGIIAAEGPEGDELLRAVDELVELRREQQGAPVQVWRVPPDQDADSALAFCEDQYDGAMSEERRPRYVLLLGDLGQVSLELQKMLAPRAFTGRLAFDAADDYASYAAKVAAIERGNGRTESGPVRARPVFFAARDGTRACRVGRTDLVEPCFDQAMALSRALRVEKPTFPESRKELIAEAAMPRGVLLSVSHGLGPRQADDGAPLPWASVAEQRARQGTPVAGRGEHLTADTVAGSPFLPGGVWLMFACYGAGTPADSVFSPWLARVAPAAKALVLAGLPSAGERPFVAALPKHLLGRSDGPLAVVGHVDITWACGFQDARPPASGTAKRPPRAERFYRVLEKLYAGSRVGPAVDELTFATGKVDQWVRQMERKRAAGAPVDERTWAQMWFQREDLAGFVLLGDPAAGAVGRNR